jgi:hypothetical protein
MIKLRSFLPVALLERSQKLRKSILLLLDLNEFVLFLVACEGLALENLLLQRLLLGNQLDLLLLQLVTVGFRLGKQLLQLLHALLRLQQLADSEPD